MVLASLALLAGSLSLSAAPHRAAATKPSGEFQDLVQPAPTTTSAGQSFDQRLADLRSDLDQRLAEDSTSRANSTIQVASLLITWSGIILTFVTLLIAAAAFFGIREVRNVRASYADAARIRDSLTLQMEEIKGLVRHWESEVATIDAKLETSMQAAYAFNQGQEAYRDGNYQKAIDFFTRASGLQPTNSQILCRLGRAYTNLGEVAAAADAFKGALSLNPNEAEALRGLAGTYRYTDSAAALEYAKQAVNKGPDDARNWNYIGLVLRDGGQLDESLEAHQRAANLRPGSPITAFYLSLLAAYQRKSALARQHMESATKRLEEEEQVGRIKPLWSAVIRWGAAVLNGDYEAADRYAGESADLCTSSRRATEVGQHFEFFLRALEREQYISRFCTPLTQRFREG
jgi:tetratricopeptide (TPR) repeat protein